MSDDFGDDDIDDDIFIQAATQIEERLTTNADDFERSPRPTKRPRLNGPVKPARSHTRDDNPANLLKATASCPRVGPSEDQLRTNSSDNDEALLEANGGKADSEERDPYDFEGEIDDIPSDVFRTSSPHQAPHRETAMHIIMAPRPALRAPVNGLRQTTLFSREGLPDATEPTAQRRNWPMANKAEPPTHHKLNLEAAKTWVYPTNLGKIRDYQFNIVQRGLFHNTLVALPTGLGKTFIAATIMLNWYRWTQDSQIVFVAPTKPLVAQQIDACFHIAGIPYSQTTVLTGEVSPAAREEEWEKKRVFFMTPQTLQADLSKGIADPKKIVLLVVDEAHRAKGSYSYVEVVKFIRRFNQSFRVLALTATPGGDVESVQEVINGLDISRVEIRTDQSIDIREYVHERDLQKEVFSYSEEMRELMDLYSQAVKPLLKEVAGINPMYSGDPIALTPYGCTKALQTWMSSPAGRTAHFGLKGKVMSIFSCLAAVAHGMDLLKYHGMAAAYHSWQDVQNKSEGDDKKKAKWRDMLVKSESFKKMMDFLKTWTSDTEFIGHPKLNYLRQVILNHLLDSQQANRGNSGATIDTRIMVFSSFRDSAEEISKCLASSSGLIKPHVFVGQATSKNSKGMSQKRQLEVIDQFKKGIYNVLIATSIGEEGLDIGEVDLIVCYDSKASPLRMLQRMGRTGRKRAGRVVLLQMEGKEVNDWGKAKDSYQQMQKEIANGDKFMFHEDRSRRILPREIQPEVDRREVEIPIENSQHNSGELPKVTRGRKSKTKKKFHMPDGVVTGFVTAGALAGGRKQSNNSTVSRKSSKKSTTTIEDEPEPNPYLDTIVLNEMQTIDFENRYLNTVSDNIFVSAPELNKYPGHQRELTKTEFVSHSRTTKSYVATMDRISRFDEFVEEQYEPYLDMDDFNPKEVDFVVSNEDVELSLPEPPVQTSKGKGPARKTSKTNAPAQKAKAKTKAKTPTTTTAPKPKGRRSLLQRVSSAMEADASSPPPSDPAYAFRNGDIDLGSRDTPPPTSRPGQLDSEDSSMDEFVVDDDVEVEMENSSDSELPSSLGISRRTKQPMGTQARLSKLHNIFSDDEDGGDSDGQEKLTSDVRDMDDMDSSLPDLKDLLSTHRKRNGGTQPTQPVFKRRRLVVDDDDEDDE
ncbi:P-loop containing nucleoside triphosphate hydrolase protein [Microthyrium microscopicum]|uniref:ATP-dependent DNA helicase n=1 Tax=Microthyrium microscopicum TaxID=703497 RepID=A0A6A6USV0_9PEZI|nr:P-loop containing nucleoside triphosphate hydrolase protein [Microthyrium microscopicum]